MRYRASLGILLQLSALAGVLGIGERQVGVPPPAYWPRPSQRKTRRIARRVGRKGK